jgi:hypothetical protein
MPQDQFGQRPAAGVVPDDCRRSVVIDMQRDPWRAR